MNRRLMQLRDLFVMKAHFGWLHFLLHRLDALPGPTRSLINMLDGRFSRYTDRRSALFDVEHHTETFKRQWVGVSEDVPASELSFGYGPVNQDFFREIMRAVPVPLSRYAFVDVGAGKGAALMLASSFPFRRWLGVELHAELIAEGRENVANFNQATQRAFAPEWVQADFMKWSLPDEDCLVFLNNPFPHALSLEAVKRMEASDCARSRRVLLVYRKAPKLVGQHLHASRFWVPLRLAPYWRIYASPALARELGRSA